MPNPDALRSPIRHPFRHFDLPSTTTTQNNRIDTLYNRSLIGYIFTSTLAAYPACLASILDTNGTIGLRTLKLSRDHFTYTQVNHTNDIADHASGEIDLR